MPTPTRDDRPDQPRTPQADPPGDPDDDPIDRALRSARAGSAVAKATLSKRARAVVLTVVAVFAASVLINGVVTTGLVLQGRASTLQQAEKARLDGAAQAQARRASSDAAPANQRLVSMRLFAIPIPAPTQSPASEVIANSASVQVLADMPRSAIVAEDYVALGAATERFYRRQPEITQSGPAPLKVQQLCQQYLRVASKLVEDGVLPPN